MSENRPLHGVTVFLDRDGTLNEDPGYLRSPDQLRVFPGVVDAVSRLKACGARLVLVTNQSGIARGYFSESVLLAIHDKLQRELGEGMLDGVFFCPHHPEDGCLCRKPRSGMVQQAVDRLHVDPRRSYVVGDAESDMELARNIGAPGVLVQTSLRAEQALAACQSGKIKIECSAFSFCDAVNWMFRDAPVRWP